MESFKLFLKLLLLSSLVLFNMKSLKLKVKLVYK